MEKVLQTLFSQISFFDLTLADRKKDHTLKALAFSLTFNFRPVVIFDCSVPESQEKSFSFYLLTTRRMLHAHKHVHIHTQICGRIVMDTNELALWSHTRVHTHGHTNTHKRAHTFVCSRTHTRTSQINSASRPFE